jgi:hypothetical protein
MPKFSIYVPDEMWAEVVKAGSDQNPSQIVQAALSDRLEQARRSTQISGELEALLEETVSAVAETGRNEFEDGYKRGLHIAAALKWEHLRELARSDPASWRIDEIEVELGSRTTAKGRKGNLELRRILEFAVEDRMTIDEEPSVEYVIDQDDRPIIINGIQQALIDTYNRVAPTWGLPAVDSIDGIRKRYRQFEAKVAEARARKAAPAPGGIEK